MDKPSLGFRPSRIRILRSSRTELLQVLSKPWRQLQNHFKRAYNTGLFTVSSQQTCKDVYSLRALQYLSCARSCRGIRDAERLQPGCREAVNIFISLTWRYIRRKENYKVLLQYDNKCKHRGPGVEVRTAELRTST